PALTGRYELTVLDSRVPGTQDQNLLEAERLYAEANAASTKGEMREAAAKYEDAAAHFKSAGDQLREAYAEHWAGFIYSGRGDKLGKQMAMEHLDNAISLSRSGGYKEIEGLSLSTIADIY